MATNVQSMHSPEWRRPAHPYDLAPTPRLQGGSHDCRAIGLDGLDDFLD